MSELSSHERAAMEAVAREFSAKWGESGDSARAYIAAGGKRVAVEIRTLKESGGGRSGAAGPRLRFDKEVVRLVGGLQATLGEAVPDGTTVLVTVTAPIRMGSKTGAALEEKIQALLRSRGRDKRGTVYGNRVRIRVLRKGAAFAPKMIGFVHNSDSDPLLLLKMTGELIEGVSAAAGKGAGDRWLVLISARRISCLQAYRYICSQLRVARKFKKTLMVFGDGRVGILAG